MTDSSYIVKDNKKKILNLEKEIEDIKKTFTITGLSIAREVTGQDGIYSGCSNQTVRTAVAHPLFILEDNMRDPIVGYIDIGFWKNLGIKTFKYE